MARSPWLGHRGGACTEKSEPDGDSLHRVFRRFRESRWLCSVESRPHDLHVSMARRQHLVTPGCADAGAVGHGENLDEAPLRHERHAWCTRRRRRVDIQLRPSERDHVHIAGADARRNSASLLGTGIHSGHGHKMQPGLATEDQRGNRTVSRRCELEVPVGRYRRKRRRQRCTRAVPYRVGAEREHGGAESNSPAPSQRRTSRPIRHRTGVRGPCQRIRLIIDDDPTGCSMIFSHAITVRE